ncbi:heme/steroid binding domain protein [Metarhizium acridum CQMa 102]|uniref:Heme/steroid binding domain protein n=1 Tax=Metarhizium acridum (strain CQMa 102) TaxID=655827 RepID=E9E193_METAQ|nr:heme/steroid binding domain protein [Metarhizium acridum CQMa 102]EFY90395.1 heme/steroid binding domain protein [Metarhizium acridum CQMa 102]
MADAELRQRKAGPASDDPRPKSSEPEPKPKSRRHLDDDDDVYSPWVDVLRVLSFLLVASCGLSYVISGGESIFWGMKDKPQYLRVGWWKSQFSGPIYLTEKELLAYDGSDAEKPLYLAINGTIYDVSSNRRMYGPGGSYNVFTGRDAARGFVTGCFAEDQTADLRGLEEMFLPVDDPEVDKYFTTAEMEKMREEELAAAKEKAHAALQHWVKFFANNHFELGDS